MKLPRITSLVLLSMNATTAFAHGRDVSDGWGAWNVDPGLVVPLLLAAAFYIAGVSRLWRRAGVGRSITRRAALSYAGGLFVLVVALLSPLDAYTSELFSVHMVQHLLLILVAPPLIVVGAPDVALLWSLPQGWRRRWGRIEGALGGWLAGTRGGGSGPLVTVLLATGVLWVWHLPQLYDLAVQNEAVHWAEHAAFLVTALFFWACILRLRPGDHAGNGLRILYVFGMALQGSLLGALITFASRPLYASHLGAAELGIAPLVDQQIAGLIMWVPPAALYIGVSCWLFVRWLDSVGRRDGSTRSSNDPIESTRPSPRRTSS